MFNPSKYNLAILNYWQTYGQRNIMIDAVAGSGKTSQIEYLCKNAPTAKKLYLVFSKDMQLEVEPRLASTGTDVKTFHAFGRQAIVKAGYRAKPDNWKYQNLLDKYNYDQDKYGISKNQFCRILSIIRGWFDPINEESVYAAIEHWDFEPKEKFDELIGEFVEFMNFINNEGSEDLDQIDFDDMIYLPLVHGFSFPRYDEIFVDEVQDLNRSKQLILLRLKGRITAVGDPHQAIFGFSGADTKSFWNLQNMLSAELFPLSVCYRCPDNVLEMAREYVPHIEGVGKSGIINEWSYMDALEHLKPGNMVICRTNAPLVSMALKLLVKGKPCKIKGRDFAESVIKLLETVEKKYPYNQLETGLSAVVNERVEKLRNESKIANLYDSQECILAIAEDCDSYHEIKIRIRSLFNDKEDGDFITLSSFHRSKGLERDNVTILSKGGKLCPPGYDQESNLVYVALTRTKNTLNFVKI